MAVEIVKIDTEQRRQVDRFIQVPFDIYKDSPYWVPPLWDDARLQLNRKKNPYYTHSDADFFVAVKDGRDVGRIALLDNRRHNEYKKERTGFFYLFDSIDDLEVSRALFGKAEEWCRAHGFNKLFGPKGFIAMDGFGILIQGFDYLPALGIPYNYPYYEKLVTDWGFQKYTDVYSCYFAGEMDIDKRIYEIADRVRERKGITIRKFKNKKELRAAVPAIVKAYNETFVDNWEFVPVLESEANAVLERLIDIAEPDLIKLAVQGDQIIGFLLAYPNIGEALQKIKGRLWPFGFITILRSVKTTKRLDLNGVGVLPKYQGGGATAVMYAEMARTVRESRFEFAELVQMEEKNIKIQSELKMLGATFFKTHRLYEKAVQ